MQRVLLGAIIALALGNTGCLLNPYSSDPNQRMQELLIDSENMRLMQSDWQHVIGHDCPSHLTPDTLDGTIVP